MEAKDWPANKVLVPGVFFRERKKHGLFARAFFKSIAPWGAVRIA